MIKKEEIFPIGIGTWKINYKNIKDEMNSLLYSYEQGQNYLSLYMLYDNGEVVKSLESFITKVDRSKLFISANIEPVIKKMEDIQKQVDEYLEVLNLEYIDNLQLHTPKATKLPLVETYKEMERLVEIGKVRYLGISNCNLQQLKEVNANVKLDFFEGVYNLECKVNEDIGIIDYCKKNDLIFIPYQVLRRNRTALRNYSILVELANRYHKTQNQILLNWIIKEKGMKPLIKCTNVERIKQNIETIHFEMNKEDYKKLNEFRSVEFDNVKIDWNSTGDGVAIDQLANQFK